MSLSGLFINRTAKIGIKIARIINESLYPVNKSENAFGFGHVFKTDFCLVK